MNEGKALLIIGQAINLVPTVVPMVQALIRSIQEAGEDATPEQINVIVNRAISNSKKIQEL